MTNPVRFSLIAALALSVAFGLLGISCETTSTRNRGSLSDAMEAARDDHEGDRDVPDERRDDGIFWHRDRDRDRNRDRYRDDEAETDQGAAVGPSLEFTDLTFGVRGGPSLADGSDIVTNSDGDIFVGASVGDRWVLDLYAGFKVAAPEEGSDLDASVRDPIVFLKAGAEGRFSPFPKAAYLSPYLLGGIGGYVMVWSFENPLESGGETIEDDSLGGLLLSAGVGIDLVRAKKFRAGIGLIGDSYLFGAVTSRGFTNDVFGYYNSARLVGEVAFRF